MELQGDESQLKARFGPFGDSANRDVRSVHGLRQTYHRLRNCFGCTQRYSYVPRLKWKLSTACLEIVLILTQDLCTVCAERTIGSEIVLDAPDGTPR